MDAVYWYSVLPALLIVAVFYLQSHTSYAANGDEDNR